MYKFRIISDHGTTWNPKKSEQSEEKLETNSENRITPPGKYTARLVLCICGLLIIEGVKTVCK